MMRETDRLHIEQAQALHALHARLWWRFCGSYCHHFFSICQRPKRVTRCATKFRMRQKQSGVKCTHAAVNQLAFGSDCALRLHQRWSFHVRCVLPLATAPFQRLLHRSGTVCRSRSGRLRRCKFSAAD